MDNKIEFVVLRDGSDFVRVSAKWLTDFLNKMEVKTKNIPTAPGEYEINLSEEATKDIVLEMVNKGLKDPFSFMKCSIDSIMSKSIIDASTREIQPSFGMLGFYRVQGSNKSLYGSSIKHGNYIELVCRRGYSERSMNNTHYFGSHSDRLLTVTMSAAQFAELITTMNTGDGIPVTISEVAGEKMPGYYVDENVIETHKREYSEEMKKNKVKIIDLQNRLKERFEEKRALTKQEKEDILKALQQVVYDYGVNEDFRLKQFEEQMERTVNQSKAEIEAFATNKMLQIGRDTIVKKAEEDDVMIPGQMSITQFIEQKEEANET